MTDNYWLNYEIDCLDCDTILVVNEFGQESVVCPNCKQQYRVEFDETWDGKDEYHYTWLERIEENEHN